MNKNNKSKRIELIDAARGFSIILMVFYHYCLNLASDGIIQESFIYSPLFETAQPIFAGFFIFLCGLSCKLSKNNLKRGLIILVCAAAVEFGAGLVGESIRFGILHLLSVSVLIYALLDKLINRDNAFYKRIKPYLPAVYIILFAITYKLTILSRYNVKYLEPLGFRSSSFQSADYTPLLPWIFVFFLGAWFGGYVVENKLPRWFYDTKVPLLAPIGRKTLWIYMLHQPIYFLVEYLITK